MIEPIFAEHALRVGATLGEGPVWIDDHLWFVDIKLQRIYRHRPGSSSLVRWEAPEPVGWVLQAEGGALVAGLRLGAHLFSPVSSRFTRLATIDADMPGNRLNDACVDPLGHIWFGTMDDGESQPTGRLYRWDGAGHQDSGAPPIVITNGPAIAPQGDLLYHVDTLGQRVTRHRIGPDRVLGAAEPFLRFDEEDGFPDGAVCDVEGGIWLGFYGGWQARRYAPDGTLSAVVCFPTANITKIALGGPDGRTAWATSARQGLSDKMLKQQPLAGDLFTFQVAIAAAPATRARIG
jgi:xylono-1,5-lactonase